MYHVSKKERRRIEIPIDRHDATPSAAQRPRSASASLWYSLGTQATRATRKRGTTAKVDSRNERRSIAVRCGAAQRSDVGFIGTRNRYRATATRTDRVAPFALLFAVHGLCLQEAEKHATSKEKISPWTRSRIPDVSTVCAR